MKTTNQKDYESPMTEIIAIEFQGVLCASGGAAFSTGGGTTNMNIQDGNGW
jgi:hypothetical protein